MRTSAIFIDWDNVYGGLHALDPLAARQIAQNPDRWMQNLATRNASDGRERRWLIRRCYMNPVGWVLDEGERIYLSRFRPFFVRAGFEVIDCPPLTRSSKNAADIRICLDVMDVLGSSKQPDELIIASSDSDFTPLLHRVRSHDLGITLITTGDAVSAYKSLADDILDAPTLLELLSDESEDAENSSEVDSEGPKVVEPRIELTDEQVLELKDRFERLVTEEYDASPGPLNLARFSAAVRRELGPATTATSWFGAGSFTGALRRLDLPNVQFNQHHVWDERRHERPAGPERKSDLPDTIAQIAAVTDLPALDRELWPPVFAALAEYASTHPFNLTESTKWTRDRLSEQGYVVGRGVVNFAMQGASLGGATVSKTPPPTADQISWAFYSAVLYRAKSAGLILDEGQVEELRTWLGAPASAPTPVPTIAST